MKKKVLKGFTLVELIIVMAVFSLLMLGAMSLVDPVSRIYKHSNDFEKTYSYVDNIQNYLQGTLQYADNVWVYQGSMTDDQIKDEVFEFKEAFYKDIVSTNNGTTVKYSKCTIHVLTLLNSDLNVSATETYPKGQILDRSITCISNDTKAAMGSLGDYTPQLNDTFFTEKYSYDYVLGASSLVRTGDSVMVNSLDPSNVESVAPGLNASSFSIGIVTYDSSQNKDGTNKVNNVSAVMPTSGSAYTYRTYDPSSQYSVANIPLMNIINRKGAINNSYYVYGYADDGVTLDTSKIESYPGTAYGGVPHPSLSHLSFEHETTEISMSSDDNIYIIYALCDEVNVPQ